MATVNPNFMNVGDASAVADGVTEFDVMVGTQTGGPYTASTATAPIGQMTDNAGIWTIAFNKLTFNPALPNGTFFAVAVAKSPGGTSGNSPEASFQVAGTPTAPTSLSFT